MIRFRSLWTIDVRHAFFGDGAEVLEFIVPPATQRALAGAHAIAHEREGVLNVLIEVDEAGQPLSALAGRRFVFGLRPREAVFETVTQPLAVGRGETALWANAAAPNDLDAPRALQLSGAQLRIEPKSAARPLALRLLDEASVERASGSLKAGEEALSLQGSWPNGEWRIEEAGTPAGSLYVEPDLAAMRAWGLLVLTVAPAHITSGQAFHLDFAARSDTLRYYVVANAYSQNEFDQVQVQDAGFAAEARAQIVFDKLLPVAFGADHLPTALLDPAGSARVACFQAQAPVVRRLRGPTRLELHRNGEVLIGNLPLPGAQRPDAQFVLHLSKP
jgi:hypothetical protein